MADNARIYAMRFGKVWPLPVMAPKTVTATA